MFNGKMKAITFSYDDGVTQDKRLISIFDKYNLKATFNINSELLGREGSLIRENIIVNHTKNNPTEIKTIYKNHEIAAHTLTHPNLTELPDFEVIRQVEQDRINLENLIDKPVLGMAYPGGGVNFNKHIKNLIKTNTKIKFARTIISSYDFEIENDLYEFKPTVYHHTEWDKMIELAQNFIQLKPNSPKLFYIWGHSYEFDIYDNWDKFDEFCSMISNRDDIFYGTNSEVLIK